MTTLRTLTVRMYRNLLGDCFLLRVKDEEDRISHILIDCGLLQGLARQNNRLIAVAEDIRATTGGHVDLLIVTHEHWDHISGFVHAADILLDPKKMAYNELWMAWTEKPGDEQAETLRLRFERRKTAIARLALAFNENNRAFPATKGVVDFAKFIGPIEANDLSASPGQRWTGRRVLEALKAMAGTTRYLEPGQVLDAPVATSLPVAVLGPPRKEQRLFKDSPSRGADKETYLGEELLTLSLLPGDADTVGGDTARPTSPFAPYYARGLDAEQVRTQTDATGHVAWLQRRYFADSDDEGRRQDGRRIDDVGFEAAESLALKLDSDTNNTSLALAFRLPDDRFLLFAADAQVGNWLSWHDQDYVFADRRWSAMDVLAATALYKVGHHGSHNATLRKLGLEMMTRPDLVAMISTVEEEAQGQGRPPGWLMPNPDVKEALLSQTRGRLIRGDRTWASDPDVQPFARSPQFAAALDESNPLYVDYHLIV